jgi:hypothetical protein
MRAPSPFLGQRAIFSRTILRNLLQSGFRFMACILLIKSASHRDSPTRAASSGSGNAPDRPQKDNLETNMPAMPTKEIATGLMTVAVALALVSAPAAYMQPIGASVPWLTVAGSPDMNAGMTVAIPVSGVGGNAVKLRNHRQDHQKHTGS